VGLTAGTGDLAAAVTYADLVGQNFMLAGPQASTDQGDPSDEVGAEPTPNGSRINLGAFGGTADAELSAPAAVDGAPSATPTPSTPTPAGSSETQSHEIADGAGGCALGGRGPDAGSAASLMLVLAALAHRRRRQRRS